MERWRTGGTKGRDSPWRIPKALRRRPRSGTLSNAFLGDAKGNVAFGVHRVMLHLGVQYGQERHVLNVRCVIEGLSL